MPAIATLRAVLVRRLAEAEQRAAFATYSLNGRGEPLTNPGTAYILEDTAIGEARAFRDAIAELDLAVINEQLARATRRATRPAATTHKESQ